MADSPSHRFGQIVGNLLEELLRPVLKKFCDDRGLYFDIQGMRSGVRQGKTVTWLDKYGNTHALDFVIEKGGTDTQRGRPVAFVEAAWRRYSKHSRNKAQEIQGAVLPIADHYNWDKPFLGAVLAGVFTEGSLDQLRSMGFKILHFPYKSIVNAFSSVGINVQFDESTPDKDFLECVKAIENLDKKELDKLKSNFVKEKEELFSEFLEELSRVLDRRLNKLIITPLFGNTQEFTDASEAILFIDNFLELQNIEGDFRKYEIIARYSNGDYIDASFSGKKEAMKFIEYVAS